MNTPQIVNRRNASSSATVASSSIVCALVCPDVRPALRSALRPALGPLVRALAASALACTMLSVHAQQPATGTKAVPNTNANTAGAANGGESLPANELTASILYQVIAAEIAAQRGQNGIATSTYLALAKMTRDPRFAKRATELALSDRSLDGALSASQLWKELAPDNDVAANTLEALYVNSGRLTLAEPLLKKRIDAARLFDRSAKSEQSTPNAPIANAGMSLADTYRSIERLLGRVQDRKAAFSLFEKLSLSDLSQVAVRSGLSALAGNAGLNERAAIEALAAHKISPDNETLLVNAVLSQHQFDRDFSKVYALLTPFLQRNPKSTEARLIYGRLLSMDGKNKESTEQLELVLKDDGNNAGVLYALAQVAYQEKKPDLAKRYLDRYLSLPRSVARDDNVAYIFMAQLSEDANDLSGAIDWLSKVQRGDQYLPAVTRSAQLLGKQNKVSQAQQLLQSITPMNGLERQQLSSAEASVLRRAGRFDDAFLVLDKALASAPNNPDLLYDQAMAAEKINKVDVMEQSLRKLIQLDPERAEAYNALGYTFAERNLRLPEALVLIEKALQLDPKNAHIMDSMGWVLFKLNRIDEAVEYLLKAYKASPEAEIAVHLGEVLWRKGRQGEAIDYWREAKKREPDNETLKETIQRLNATL